MEKGSILMRMEISMLDNISMELLMATGSIIGLTGLFTREISNMESVMAMEYGQIMKI